MAHHGARSRSVARGGPTRASPRPQPLPAQAVAGVAAQRARSRALPPGPVTPYYSPQGAEQALVREGLVGPGAGLTGMGPASKPINVAGGEIVQRLQPESLPTYEQLFTALPEEGMFSPALSPQQPFQFTFGSFTVPKSRTLWLTDYRCGVLLFDGVGPGDYRVAGAGRFRGVMGFRVERTGAAPGVTSYQLDPVPVQTARQQFEEVVAPAGAPAGGRFNRHAATQFATVAGQGTSLLPVWAKVMGPRDGIWTWVLEEGNTVNVSCVVFRPIPVPIAGVFARLAGHLVHVEKGRAVQERTKPR